MKKRRKKFKGKNNMKEKYKKNIIESMKEKICILRSKPPVRRYFLIYDKYILYIASILSTVLFFIAPMVAFWGLFILKNPSHPLVWGSISYILIYYLKSQFTLTIYNFSYFNRFKTIINIVKFIFLLLIAPILIVFIPNIHKLIDSYVFLVIPIIYYLSFRLLALVLQLNATINANAAITIRSYKRTRDAILLLIFCHILLIIYIYTNLREHGDNYHIYYIRAQALFHYMILSMISYIVILFVVILKRKNKNKWRMVKDGVTLYRYNHFNGEVKQIYKESFYGVFIPMKKYSNYSKIDDDTLYVEWKKTAKKIYFMHEPDSTQMMINNEFSSNLLFFFYNITHHWPRIWILIFRYLFSLIGIFLLWKGFYLLIIKNNTLYLYLGILLTLIGILLTWCSIFAFIVYFSIKENRKDILDSIFTVSVTVLQVILFILNFNIYKKIIILDFIIFIYMFINFRTIQNKVKRI